VKITVEDRYRLGRIDDRWYFYFMLEHSITKAFSAGLTYRHFQKNVDLPAEDLKDILEASSNSIYLIFEYKL
jgi:hypothetical protein